LTLLSVTSKIFSDFFAGSSFGPACRKDVQRANMVKTVPIIGIAPSELPWIRRLVQLLRHPDPGMAELARQALVYLSEAAGECEATQSNPLNSAR
jgi:hypothetical protein